MVKLTATSLTMRLKVTNSGDADFNYQALLHTYFRIPDIANVAISGLKGLNYIDKVAGGKTKAENREKVVLPEFTDRIYIGTNNSASEVKIMGEAGSILYTVINAASGLPCD